MKGRREQGEDGVSKVKGQKMRCFCGAKLRRGARECPRCHRVTKAGLNANLRKAVAAAAGPSFTGKAAAGPQAAWCSKGHPSRPGGTCCTSCGDLMPGVPVPPLSAVGKSAVARNFWTAQLGNSPRPADRELLYQALYGENGDRTA
jgi:hypothetical protein